MFTVAGATVDIDEIDLAINLLKAGMAMDVPFSARVFSYCDPLENQLTYENGKYTLKTMYAISMPDGSNHKQIQKETIFDFHYFEFHNKEVFLQFDLYIKSADYFCYPTKKKRTCPYI